MAPRLIATQPDIGRQSTPAAPFGANPDSSVALVDGAFWNTALSGTKTASDRTAEPHTRDSSHTAVSRIGWRYPGDGDRDLRLDFLRGLCLLKMVFDHLPRTPLHRYLHWTGYVTAAEGFFIISGVVLGIVYRRRVAQKGLAPATRTLWRRAGSLYLSNMVLVLLFACLEVYGALPRHNFEYLWETEGFHWWTLLHLNQPYFLHVLPRYVFFLAFAPAAIWLLMHRKG